MIFPKEIINNTSEYFHYRYEIKSRVIFGLVVALLLCTIAALPFITTDVYVKAFGVIKPIEERSNIISPSSGLVASYNLINNLNVKKGDTLLILNNGTLRLELEKRQNERKYLTQHIADLDYLLSDSPDRTRIKLSANRLDFLKHKQRLRQLETKIEQADQEYSRQSKLYQEEVISEADFEKVRYANLQLKDQRDQQIKDQYYQWESDLRDARLKIQSLRSDIDVLLKQLDELILVAPLNGTLFNVKKLPPSAYVTAGEVIAELSPDSKLIVEAYLSPSDIGLIRHEANVNYQIDAFNYNQWGLASGSITDISQDVELFNNQPVFKVRSSLNESFLTLSNGYKGELKKGLTLSARYLITRRSLFDLLYDKVDDWLNPAQNPVSNPNITQE